MARWGYAAVILRGHPYIQRSHVAQCARWVADLTDFDNVKIVSGCHRGYLHDLKYYNNCDVCLLPVYSPIDDLQPVHIPRDMPAPPRPRPFADPPAWRFQEYGLNN